MINPIRSAIACLQFTDLWDLMRLDGVTELPGALSKLQLELVGDFLLLVA